MKFRKFPHLLTGNANLPKIDQIYNTACFIAMMFCLMAAIECIFAKLNPILIANNFFYSVILALSFYLSRIKQKIRVSRFLAITVLLFIYTPILWVYNGGSASGIPYYILLFFSFLTILTKGEDDSNKSKVISGIILITYSLIMTGLLFLEFLHPEIFYSYDNRIVRYSDIIISMLFALGGNYLILRAFINQYYQHLAEIKEYSRRLEELVVRDSMTKLYNHAFIVTRLTEEIEKAARYLRPLSVLMIDIDHFKDINDTYGHDFGDEVLIKIADAIQSCCRSVDIASRYGGEEFLIILPETNATSATVVGERLENIIQNLKFSHDIIITVSGGIVQYKNGNTPSQVFKRVDSLLYQAKNEGRNRIKVGDVGDLTQSDQP
jgi:diguanylate cyclase (GGDEF)-like protein